MGRKVKARKNTGWKTEENQDILNLLFHHKGIKTSERLYREARIQKAYREKAGISVNGAQIVSPEILSQQYQHHQNKYSGTRRVHRMSEEKWIERQYREAINMMNNQLNWGDAYGLNALWNHASAEDLRKVASMYPDVKTSTIGGVLTSNIDASFFRNNMTQEDVDRINEIYLIEGPKGAFSELMATLVSKK